MNLRSAKRHRVWVGVGGFAAVAGAVDAGLSGAGCDTRAISAGETH